MSPRKKPPADPPAPDPAVEAEPAPRARRVRLVRAKPQPKKIRLVRRAPSPLSGEATDEADADLEAATASDDGPTGALARSWLDAILPDLLKRVVAASGEALTEDALRRVLAEAPLPRGLNTSGLRGELQKTISREVRDFLDHVDLSGELQKILSSLTLEIRTEVRFVPNGDQTQPQVKNRVRVKRGAGDKQ